MEKLLKSWATTPCTYLSLWIITQTQDLHATLASTRPVWTGVHCDSHISFDVPWPGKCKKSEPIFAPFLQFPFWLLFFEKLRDLGKLFSAFGGAGRHGIYVCHFSQDDISQDDIFSTFIVLAQLLEGKTSDKEWIGAVCSSLLFCYFWNIPSGIWVQFRFKSTRVNVTERKTSLRHP